MFKKQPLKLVKALHTQLNYELICSILPLHDSSMATCCITRPFMHFHQAATQSQKYTWRKEANIFTPSSATGRSVWYVFKSHGCGLKRRRCSVRLNHGLTQTEMVRWLDVNNSVLILHCRGKFVITTWHFSEFDLSQCNPATQRRVKQLSSKEDHLFFRPSKLLWLCPLLLISPQSYSCRTWNRASFWKITS